MHIIKTFLNRQNQGYHDGQGTCPVGDTGADRNSALCCLHESRFHSLKLRFWWILENFFQPGGWSYPGEFCTEMARKFLVETRGLWVWKDCSLRFLDTFFWYLYTTCLKMMNFQKFWTTCYNFFEFFFKYFCIFMLLYLKTNDTI